MLRLQTGKSIAPSPPSSTWQLTTSGWTKPLSSREIGYDPSACVLTMEHAVVNQEWLAIEDAPGDTGDEEGSVQDHPVEDISTLGTAASRSRYYEVRYEDPPNLDVTRVRSRLTWVYNGSCVTGSSNHVVDLYKRTSTGWNLQSGGWVTSSRNCSQARTTANNYMFYNSPFCKAIQGPTAPTTYNYYTTVAMIGKLDGSFSGARTVDKWGGCASLLSLETRFVSF